MTFPVVYEPAAKVAPGPTPGAKALMAWCLNEYHPGTNLGIYNPRNVRGGVALSLHAEGRAIDVGYPTMRPDGHPMGRMLAAHMAEHHAGLGVQCVIFARRIWSNTHPTWRPYTGTADHFDHVHIELTREAAAGLTTDIIRQTLEATVPPTRTDYARQIQEALISNGATTLVPDDKLGPATVAATRAVLTFLNTEVKRLGREIDGLKVPAGALADALARREAAEAEAAALRQQLQQGGRLPQLLADLDTASKDLDRAANAIANAITKARA